MTRSTQRRQGFTLAEVAVTIVIVGIGLTMVLQTLNRAKFTAAHTANQKLARELALLTLGQIQSGLYQEEELDGMFGDYGSEGRENFTFEIAIGENTLTDEVDDSEDPDARFDRWAWERERERERTGEDEDDEDDEDAAEAYETVTIRVTFPKFQEFTNTLTLERWIPWEQVYGEPEEDEQPAERSGDAPEDQNP